MSICLDADGHGAVSFLDCAGRVADCRRADGGRDVGGAEAGPAGFGGFHPQAERRPCVVRPIIGIDDARDAFQEFLDGGSVALQYGNVGREDFHFDGLGRPGEVADQVAEDAMEIPVDARCDFVGLGPDFVEDFVCRSFAVIAQFHQEIPRTGFRDSKRESCAGAAGIALHFRRGLEDFFQCAELSVSFGKAGARWREIIDDKTALIHFREEVGLQSIIYERRGDKHESADGKRPALAE